jgi:transcription initiation factor TFIIB
MYRRASSQGLIRGRAIQQVVATAVYMACRKCGVPRTLEEVAYSSQLEKHKLGKCYRALCKAINFHAPPTSPTQFIARLISNLQLIGAAEITAKRMLRILNKLQLNTGKGPMGIAAAVIYITSIILNEHRTQREIAEETNVTEVTIRKRYKDIVQNIEILIRL